MASPDDGPRVDPDEARRIAAMPPFCEVVTTNDGHVVVRVTGDIDMAEGPQLAECLTRFGDTPVTVDLSGVTFIGSSGLSALVAAHKRTAYQGGRLVVEGPSPIVLRIIEVTGLGFLLEAT